MAVKSVGFVDTTASSANNAILKRKRANEQKKITSIAKNIKLNRTENENFIVKHKYHIKRNWNCK